MHELHELHFCRTDRSGTSGQLQKRHGIASYFTGEMYFSKVINHPSLHHTMVQGSHLDSIAVNLLSDSILPLMACNH
jgi:hypothetical protein